jgi:hypothetical protein
MQESTKRKQETKPGADDAVIDIVNETSEESFPASDPPSWTVESGEKGSEPNHSAKADPAAQGCATSFILQERGEIGGVCGEVQQPAPKEEYVQPEKEKEAGGEA